MKLPDNIRILDGYGDNVLPSVGERLELASQLRDAGLVPVLSYACEPDRTPVEALAEEIKEQYSDYGGGIVGPYVMNREVVVVDGVSRVLPLSAPHGVSLWSKAS